LFEPWRAEKRPVGRRIASHVGIPGRRVTIQTRLVGTITVVDVRGTLTSTEGDPGLRQAIRVALDNGARTVVINLQNVTAIDSSGIADLASSHMTIANRDGRLKICNMSQKIKDIFASTRLDTVFETYDSEADAIASFPAK
jgi:anti-sigma B factor antagonist